MAQIPKIDSPEFLVAAAGLPVGKGAGLVHLPPVPDVGLIVCDLRRLPIDLIEDGVQEAWLAYAQGDREGRQIAQRVNTWGKRQKRAAARHPSLGDEAHLRAATKVEIDPDG